ERTAPPKPAGRISASRLEQAIEAVKTLPLDSQDLYIAVLHLQFQDPIASRREEVGGYLERALASPLTGIRSSAVRALGRWGTKQNVPALLKVVKSAEPSDRYDAIDAIGALGGSAEAAEVMLQ